MDDEREGIKLIKCPKCGQLIVINLRWTAGGDNDYGSFVLRCDNCGHEFEKDIGRDVMDSDVASGATVIDRKIR